MELYFLRHGEAEDAMFNTPDADFERNLTEKGMNDLILEAFGLKQIVDRFDVILTSPLVRAVQTASVFGKVYECEDRIIEAGVLKPPCLLADLLETLALQGRVHRVLCVGHTPSLGELATELLTGIEEEDFFRFQKGGVLRMDISSPTVDTETRLVYFLSPGILMKMGENFDWDQFDLPQEKQKQQVEQPQQEIKTARELMEEEEIDLGITLENIEGYSEEDEEIDLNFEI
ncbi:MAG: phosphohistidine phosphatase SixA [Vulcanimicrobiota bacterium]